MSFKQAKWIECKNVYAPKFKKQFVLEKEIESAALLICGLGFFEAEINGKRVSEDVLVPAWSDYEPRRNRRMLYPINDTFTHRVYYMEYDVSDLLKKGVNEITVILGNGWYKQDQRNIEGDFWYGDLKLCFELCINGSLYIISDESVTVSESNVVFNNIYFGERQDFNIREEYNKKAQLCDAPEGITEKQSCPADRVQRMIYPKKISSGAKDVYDCGENITGWAVFKICKKGKTTVKYAEEITNEAEPDFESAGGEEQIQSDVYISDGQEHLCRPKFTWHGFRYFEITGEHTEPIVEVVYADVKVTSSFRCSNEIINRLYENYVRSQLTNMHCGVPSDCPHRERLGYTGDGQLTCDAAMHITDAEKFYRKWIRDIADCQDIKSGHIQHTAPFYGGGGGPGGWGCAIVTVPYFYYKNYGDAGILREYFPNMKKWCGYMDSRLENGLIVREEEKGWCLGEWGLREEILLPEPYVNTYFYIKSLMYMTEIAEVIGEDTSCLKEKIKLLKDAFSREYYDAEENCVLEGVQGAEAFYCDLGMGNGNMLKRINERYRKLGKMDTGIFGTDVLIRVLFENGYQDTAVMLLSSTEKDTFADQIKNKGATTLWEYWNGEYSHNHPMFGACVKYLFTELMGMKKGKIFKLEPKPSEVLDEAQAKLEVDGKSITAGYKLARGKITFTISTQLPVLFCWDNKEYELKENTETVFTFPERQHHQNSVIGI